MSSIDDFGRNLCHNAFEAVRPRITDLYAYGHAVVTTPRHSFFISFA
ncbi:hypothetical protein JIP62_08350 [Brevundimonas vitis]|uniref:Uncharacterized protein n=1 Tax=Brevundimonas vitisensis TaxID=2800818 RepID=A0ABX7BJF1_9CAUL|nr:hypothetical protein [Brevundimonas vitisensis]QQQ17372.1 hypothetical protein JIP62_08350 [Brevundimonas vitisensis]